MSNKPTYYAFSVKDREAADQTDTEKDTIWTKIGAAWPNKDGKGFTVQLDVLPLNGRVVLREPYEENGAEVQPTSPPA